MSLLGVSVRQGVYLTVYPLSRHNTDTVMPNTVQHSKAIYQNVLKGIEKRRKKITVHHMRKKKAAQPGRVQLIVCLLETFSVSVLLAQLQSSILTLYV